MDSTSGSIRDSATTSPLMMSPRSPPGSPMESVAPVVPPGGIQGAVQDVVSRAYQALMNIGMICNLNISHLQCYIIIDRIMKIALLTLCLICLIWTLPNS